MPHVMAGKSGQQKQKLANAITKAIGEMLHYGVESVSVGFEEIAAKDWTEKVYKPDILRKKRQRVAVVAWQILTAPRAASALYSTTLTPAVNLYDFTPVSRR